MGISTTRGMVLAGYREAALVQSCSLQECGGEILCFA